MSTRSLTIVKDGGALVAMYRQTDGYLTGHGKELLDFLEDRQIVNGLGFGQPAKISNTLQDLAAQLVCHFKASHEVGGIYLQPISEAKTGSQEYVYVITVPEVREIWTGPADRLVMTVYNNGKRLFRGPVAELRKMNLEQLDGDE